MMIFISKVSRLHLFIALVLMFQSYPCVGQNDKVSHFAEYLMNQRDYFRAISVYKKMLFESQQRALSYKYATRIAEGYRLSGKYKSSIYFYSESLNYATTPDERAHSLAGLGLNYYHLRTVPIAKNYFLQSKKYDTTGKTTLFLGLIQLQEEQWTSARETFTSLTGLSRNPLYAEKAKLLRQKSEMGANLPRKSPLLAAALSSIIPGSGQIYTGHYFDGLQAMAYVGAFSLATYSAYRYDRDIRDSDALLLLSATVTGFFYLANVLGAHQTAKYRNNRVKQDFMDEIKSVIFEVSF